MPKIEKEHISADHVMHDNHLDDVVHRLPEDVQSFIEVLSIPLSIYDHLAQKFMYVNDAFMALTNKVEEDCYEHTQPQFGDWIEKEDADILEYKMWDKIVETCHTYVHFERDHLTYMINYRLKKTNDRKEQEPVLVQTNVLEWTEDHNPKVSINLYLDIKKRKHSNKIMLTIGHLQKPERKWETVHVEEFYRVPTMLANREREIIKEMLQDKSATEIAKSKNISVYTVRSHWRNILQKTNCSSQKELKNLALERGWL